MIPVLQGPRNLQRLLCCCLFFQQPSALSHQTITRTMPLCTTSVLRLKVPSLRPSAPPVALVGSPISKGGSGILPPPSPPELPTQCCMSGCANCVWLDYADEVVGYYEARGQKMELSQLLDEIEANISDEMVKAFIKMEVKSKFLFARN